MNLRFEVIAEYWPLFLEGLRNALLLTVLCLATGIVLGIVLGMGRLADSPYAPTKHFLRYGIQWPVRLYVSFFRGTPLFVKIMLFHFAVMPLLIHPENGLLIRGETARHLRGEYGPFLSGFVAISLNLGAYLSEVFRAGIQSLDRGQTEAARALGMGYWQSMRHVVLPQAFTRMLPATGNHAIFTIKDTSLVSAIGFTELTYAARSTSAATARTWEPYLAVSVMYWLIVVLMAWGVSRLEASLGHGDRS
jgi:ABC-type amino acid transport system permease subunit